MLRPPPKRRLMLLPLSLRRWIPKLSLTMEAALVPAVVPTVSMHRLLMAVLLAAVSLVCHVCHVFCLYFNTLLQSKVPEGYCSLPFAQAREHRFRYSILLPYLLAVDKWFWLSFSDCLLSLTWSHEDAEKCFQGVPCKRVRDEKEFIWGRIMILLAACACPFISRTSQTPPGRHGESLEVLSV